MSTSDRNRRRFDRHGTRLRCKLQCDQAAHVGFATDLSASGLFVQITQPLPAGAKVVVEIDVDGSTPLRLTGTVARARRPHRSVVALSTQRGVGITVESAPEAYYQLMLDLQPNDEG